MPQKGKDRPNPQYFKVELSDKYKILLDKVRQTRIINLCQYIQTDLVP